MSQHENSTRTATDPAASAARLPATLRLGAVHLTVSDLDRSIAFYRDAIGLRLHRREDPVAAMGAGGEDLIVLHEEPGARRAGRHAGLYHYALLYPSREELARTGGRRRGRGARGRWFRHKRPVGHRGALHPCPELTVTLENRSLRCVRTDGNKDFPKGRKSP